MATSAEESGKAVAPLKHKVEAPQFPRARKTKMAAPVSPLGAGEQAAMEFGPTQAGANLTLVDRLVQAAKIWSAPEDLMAYAEGFRRGLLKYYGCVDKKGEPIGLGEMGRDEDGERMRTVYKNLVAVPSAYVARAMRGVIQQRGETLKVLEGKGTVQEKIRQLPSVRGPGRPKAALDKHGKVASHGIPHVADWSAADIVRLLRALIERFERGGEVRDKTMAARLEECVLYYERAEKRAHAAA